MEPKPVEVSTFQRRCMDLIGNNIYERMDINGLARFTRSSRLAVYSAMESLKRKKLAFSIRNREDQWGILVYYLTDSGRSILGKERGR